MVPREVKSLISRHFRQEWRNTQGANVDSQDKRLCMEVSARPGPTGML